MLMGSLCEDSGGTDDDEGAWDELAYTLRARLLTRARGRRQTAARTVAPPLVVAAPQITSWLEAPLAVARYCLACRAAYEDGDAAWRGFVAGSRWAVARSPLGAGFDGDAVLARLPADVLALAREGGAAMTLAATLVEFERARRRSLVRRGWVGSLDRHFLARDTPEPFRGWERRRWRVGRARRGAATVIEARDDATGAFVWQGCLDARARVRRIDRARLAAAATSVDASASGVFFRIALLNMPIVFRAPEVGAVDDLTELLVLLGSGDFRGGGADGGGAPGGKLRATASTGIALFVAAAAVALFSLRAAGFVRLLRAAPPGSFLSALT